MSFSTEAALELIALNEAGYALATTGHCTLPDGFTDPVAIRMPPGARPFLLRHDPLDIWGYVTTRAGKIYMAFRGTEIVSGWEFGQEWALDDFCLPLVPFGAGHVHRGFYGAWQTLRIATLRALVVSPVHYEPANLIVTGHSLGAAIATLCWADLGGALTTFGCPRVGDPKFADSLWDGQTVRVVNLHDIVPDVPTDPPFRHGGLDPVVHGPGSPLDRRLAHALASYAAGLKAT